ncbi:hypothetical protein WR25_09199 isoform A [Diploscapter pachys]|uniref:Uncharacterized protein n=1 Tax=Diploscapter pachys TaxID=2018661 RepID=A0A2A2LYL1_9BILA|nr:hypothetical protein WR25_09199 isoform A [Diploscapter pachys]
MRLHAFLLQFLFHLTWAQFDLFSSQQTMEEISDQFGMSKALAAWGKVFRRISNRHDPKYNDPSKLREFTISPKVPEGIDPNSLRKKKGEIINEKLLNIILPRIKGENPFPTSTTTTTTTATTTTTTQKPTTKPKPKKSKKAKSQKKTTPLPQDDTEITESEGEEYPVSYEEESENDADEEETEKSSKTSTSKKPTETTKTAIETTTTKPVSEDSATKMATTTVKEPQFTVVFHTQRQLKEEEAKIESTILRMINETVKEKEKITLENSTSSTPMSSTPSTTKKQNATTTVSTVTVSDSKINATTTTTAAPKNESISDVKIPGVNIRIPSEPIKLENKPEYIKKLEELYLNESRQVEKLLAPSEVEKVDNETVTTGLSRKSNAKLEHQLKEEAKRLLNLLDVEKQHDRVNYDAFEQRQKERDAARNKINEFLQKMENLNAILAAKAETKNKTEKGKAQGVKIITANLTVEDPKNSTATTKLMTTLKVTSESSTTKMTTTEKPSTTVSEKKNSREETTTTTDSSKLPEAEEEEEESSFSQGTSEEDNENGENNPSALIAEGSTEDSDEEAETSETEPEKVEEKKKDKKSGEEVKMRSMNEKKKGKKDKKKRKKSKKHHSDAAKIPMEDEPATTQSTTLAADIGGSNSTAPSTGSTVFNLNANANSESNPNIANVITPVVGILDGISPILLPLLSRPRVVASGSRTYTPEQDSDRDVSRYGSAAARGVQTYDTKDPSDSVDAENSLIGFGTQIAREILAPGSMRRDRMLRQKAIEVAIETAKKKSKINADKFVTGAPLDLSNSDQTTNESEAIAEKERRRQEMLKKREEAREQRKALKEEKKRRKLEKVKKYEEEIPQETAPSYLPPYFVPPPKGYSGPLAPPPPPPEFLTKSKTSTPRSRRNSLFRYCVPRFMQFDRNLF